MSSFYNDAPPPSHDLNYIYNANVASHYAPAASTSVFTDSIHVPFTPLPPASAAILPPPTPFTLPPLPSLLTTVAAPKQAKASTSAPSPNAAPSPVDSSFNTADMAPQPYDDPITGESVYPCPHCSKQYTGKHARSIWRRHLQDKHAIPLSQQPRRTRWDNDVNRPKTDTERRERTLESKRRWARKNRATQRARAAGLPEPTDDDFDENGFPLPGRLAELVGLGPGEEASRASSTFSDSNGSNSQASRQSGTPFFDVPVVQSPGPYQQIPPLRRAVSVAADGRPPQRLPMHRVSSAPTTIDGIPTWHPSPQRGGQYLMPLPLAHGQSPNSSYAGSYGRPRDLSIPQHHDVFSGPLSAPIIPTTASGPFLGLNASSHSPPRPASAGAMDLPSSRPTAYMLQGGGPTAFFGAETPAQTSRPGSAGASPRGLEHALRISPPRQPPSVFDAPEDVKPAAAALEASEEAAMQLLALGSSSSPARSPEHGAVDGDESYLSKTSTSATNFSFQLPAHDDDDGSSPPPQTSPPSKRRASGGSDDLRASKRSRPAHLVLDTPIRDPLLPLSIGQGAVPLSSPDEDAMPPQLSSATRWPNDSTTSSSSSAFGHSTPFHPSATAFYRASPPGGGGYLFSSPGNPDMSRSLGLVPDAMPSRFANYGTPATMGKAFGEGATTATAGQAIMAMPPTSSPTKWLYDEPEHGTTAAMGGESES